MKKAICIACGNVSEDARRIGERCLETFLDEPCPGTLAECAPDYEPKRLEVTHITSEAQLREMFGDPE